MMDGRCQIEMLGGLRVRQQDRLITRFSTRKTASLLAYLAYNLHQSHPREQLVEMFWPGSDERAGRNCLSVALNSLRRQLEPPGVPAGTVLVANYKEVRLNPAAVTTDVAELRSWLRRAEHAASDGERAQYLARAIEIYRGELLPGYFDAWVVQETARLESLYSRARQRLKALRHSLSPPLSPVASGPKPTTQERTPSLPVQFTRFVGREEEIAQLGAALAPGATNPRAGRLITLSGPAGTGKTRLAVELAAHLSRAYAGAVWFVPLSDLSDARLIPVAITSALSLPRSLQVEPLEQAIEVLSRQPSLLVLDNFEHLLGEKPGNADSGSQLVEALLERTPTLRCLVTSRRALALKSEREFALSPLPVPELVESPEHLLSNESVQLFVDRAQHARADFQLTRTNAVSVARLCQRLEGVPLAIELAAARALVVTPAQMLSQVEHRFDFLVSRRRGVTDRHQSLRAAVDWSYRLLSPALRRFFPRLSVFRGGWTSEAAEAVCGEPNAATYLQELRRASMVLTEETEHGARFRMLETLREFGWEQLTPAERDDLLRRHACHYTGLAETGQAHMRGPLAPAWLDCLECDYDNLLAALDRSIHGPVSTEQGLRLAGASMEFWKWRDHIREERQRLECLLADTASIPPLVRARATFSLGVLARCAGDFGPAIEWFEQSLALFRNAGDRRAETEVLGALGVQLALVCGEPARGWELLDESVRIGREIDPQQTPFILGAVATTALNLGDLERARPLYETCVGEARARGDVLSLSELLGDLGYLYFCQAEYEHAAVLLEERIALIRQLKTGPAHPLWLLANIHLCRGEYERAEALFQESLEHNRRGGYRSGMADALSGWSMAAMYRGELAAARARQEEALALRQAARHRSDIAQSEARLGLVALYDGDLAGARAMLESALTALRQAQEKRGIAFALYGLGRVVTAEGDPDSAATLLSESLLLRRDLPDRRGIVETLEALAKTHPAPRAARMLGAATTLRETIGAPLPPVDQPENHSHRSKLRAELGEAAFGAAWKEGCAMTWERATAYALQEDCP